MKKLLGLLALLALASLPATAQLSISKIEVGGGYTFRSFAPPPSFAQDGVTVVNFPRVNMNGFDFNAVYNVNSWIGVAADVDGTRNTTPDSAVAGNDTTWIYTVMAGPRVYPLGHHKLTVFAQVLFGHAYFTVTVPMASGCGGNTGFSCKFTDGSFGFSAGGGVDWSLNHHLAVRLGEFDYERTAFPQIATATLSDTNNNYKYKAGVLIRF
jgi:opacity protein-like surface antigen